MVETPRIVRLKEVKGVVDDIGALGVPCDTDFDVWADLDLRLDDRYEFLPALLLGRKVFLQVGQLGWVREAKVLRAGWENVCCNADVLSERVAHLVDVIVGNGAVMFIGSSNSDDPIIGTGLDAALDVGGAWTEACFVLAIGTRGGGFVLANTALAVVVLAGGADVLYTALDIGGSRTEARVELASGATDDVGVEAGACTTFA